MLTVPPLRTSSPLVCPVLPYFLTPYPYRTPVQPLTVPAASPAPAQPLTTQLSKTASAPRATVSTRPTPTRLSSRPNSAMPARVRPTRGPTTDPYTHAMCVPMRARCIHLLLFHGRARVLLHSILLRMGSA